MQTHFSGILPRTLVSHVLLSFLHCGFLQHNVQLSSCSVLYAPSFQVPTKHSHQWWEDKEWITVRMYVNSTPQPGSWKETSQSQELQRWCSLANVKLTFFPIFLHLLIYTHKIPISLMMGFFLIAVQQVVLLRSTPCLISGQLVT